MDKQLNEGLFGMLVNTLFTYAAAKHIEKDPEIQAMLKKHTEKIAQLSKEMEDAVRRLNDEEMQRIRKDARDAINKL